MQPHSQEKQRIHAGNTSLLDQLWDFSGLVTTGNQGEHFQWFCMQEQHPVCWAPRWHGRAGASDTGHSGFIAPRKSSERFPAGTLPALDCRCCCLISTSSPALRDAWQPRAGWHQPILRVHLPQLLFPMLFTSSFSSSSCAGLVLGCQCSGARAGA